MPEPTFQELWAAMSPRERAEYDALSEPEAVAPGLMDFIVEVSPHYEKPIHLLPIVESLERAYNGEELHEAFSTPPQHTKTETIIHALARYAKFKPKRHAYATYNTKQANEVSRKFKQLCERAGIAGIEGNQAQWTFQNGASVSFIGINSGLTGKAVDGMLIVDDPIKNRVEAESLTFRERADDFLKSSAVTRMHPGSSIFVVQTRWHTDDLIGRVTGPARKWRYINLEAITYSEAHPEGVALWPSQRPLRWLLGQRELLASDYDWRALFFGAPTPRGGRIFEDVFNFEAAALPKKGYRVAIGVDLAYTAKTSADWSIAVVIAEYDGWWYVLEVLRGQCTAPEFAKELSELQARYPGANTRWYAAGTEKGSADWLKSDTFDSDGKLVPGLRLTVKNATGDKLVRAGPVARAWKRGRVLLPKETLVNKHWLVPFVQVVCGFTGVNDDKDDDVDALAAAFDQLPANIVDQEELANDPGDHPLKGQPMFEAAKRAQEKRVKVNEDETC